MASCEHCMEHATTYSDGYCNLCRVIKELDSKIERLVGRLERAEAVCDAMKIWRDERPPTDPFVRQITIDLFRAHDAYLAGEKE